MHILRKHMLIFEVWRWTSYLQKIKSIKKKEVAVQPPLSSLGGGRTATHFLPWGCPCGNLSIFMF